MALLNLQREFGGQNYNPFLLLQAFDGQPVAHRERKRVANSLRPTNPSLQDAALLRSRHSDEFAGIWRHSEVFEGIHRRPGQHSVVQTEIQRSPTFANHSLLFADTRERLSNG